MFDNYQETTTACAACDQDTGGNDMLCYDCETDYENDEAEQKQMEADSYYDRPDVIAGEVFQDRLDTFRNEH